MGKGFKAGAGGANPLNFDIVGGTTAPSNPQENTIWVNTDQTITSWIFSATEPVEPVEGMVWINSGTNSSVEFNALKKNGLHVYPRNVKQFISQKWASKSAKSYLNGEWASWWDGELYSPGNEYEDVTGGWVAVALRGNGGGYNYATAAPTITKGTEFMDISQSGSAHGIGRPANLIDLTNYSKINIKYSAMWSSTSSPQPWMCFSVTPRGGYWSGGNAATVDCTIDTDLNTIRTATLDVSSISGTYDVVAGMGQLDGTRTIRVYDIKMER